MLRSVTLGVVTLLLAACGTTAPVGSPTAAPTSSAAATPTAGPTQPATPSAAPTTAPSSGTVQPGGTDWGDTTGGTGGEVGERFLFQCPPGGSDLSIWGTDVYTADSSVCTAAVHAGLITLAAGGAVTIEIRPGQDSYVGSTRNGITSNEYGSWGSSFAFVGGTGVSPTPSAAPWVGYGANTLLLADDFSDTSGGWDVGSGPNGSVAYESEMLKIDLTADVSYLSTSGPVAAAAYDVIRIEATVTVGGGNLTNYVGLLCGPSTTDAVGAVVGTDGVYAFIKRSGTAYEALNFSQGVPLLQNDLPAGLTLECAGTNSGSLRLRLSFNGAPVAEFTGDAGPANFQRASVYVEGKTGAGFTVDDVSVFGGVVGDLPPLPTSPPSPGQSPSGAPSAELTALLAHVPDQMRMGCNEVTTLSAGEILSAQCSPDDVDGYVTYTLFDNDGDMSDKFFGDADYFYPGGLSNDAGDCSAGPAWNAYYREGFVYGRLFCNTYTGISPDGMIMHWFDDALLIEAGLVLHSGTFADLYDTFMMAGPIP